MPRRPAWRGAMLAHEATGAASVKGGPARGRGSSATRGRARASVQWSRPLPQGLPEARCFDACARRRRCSAWGPTPSIGRVLSWTASATRRATACPGRRPRRPGRPGSSCWGAGRAGWASRRPRRIGPGGPGGGRGESFPGALPGCPGADSGRGRSPLAHPGARASPPALTSRGEAVEALSRPAVEPWWRFWGRAGGGVCARNSPCGSRSGAHSGHAPGSRRLLRWRPLGATAG
jgi:hypothetical protein